jgi:sperm-associated antigen 16 protein
MCRYDLKAQGKLPAAAQQHVPDAYLHNAALSGGVIELEERLKEAKDIAAKASSSWNTLRKERDFHRMHHKRVTQV